MNKKHALIQTCAPDYRQNIFNYLLDNIEGFEIYSGNEYYVQSVKAAKNDRIYWVENYFFLKRNILFQKLPFLKIIQKKTVIIEFNPRNISLYLILFSRILLNKKTFLWGHAWARSGRKSKSELLRYALKLICSGIITYTKKEAAEIQQQLPKKKIYTAANALFFSEQLKPTHINSNKIDNFIYVGRLVEEKKIMLLIKAFHLAIPNISEETQLLVIGNGDVFNSIKRYIDENNVFNRIKLLGHISNFEDLNLYYSRSIASVSPGYVGLSITQSLGFGVPMIFSKNENHAPEIEAAKSGFNSIAFQTNSVEALSKTIQTVLENKNSWINKRKEISEDCRNKYSIEKMAEPFLEITHNFDAS